MQNDIYDALGASSAKKRIRLIMPQTMEYVCGYIVSCRRTMLLMIYQFPMTGTIYEEEGAAREEDSNFSRILF